MTDTEPRLRKLVASHLGIDPERVTTAAKFDDLGADSLDSVELSLATEDEFGVSIDDDAALDAFELGSTFGAAVALIDAKRAGRLLEQRNIDAGAA